MREKELSKEHSPSDVKQALAIASKMGGNMTGATAAIEKKSKGLSKHKQVAAVLKRANEEVKEGLGDLAHLAEQDHEVQMARAELYKLAKYAIKLHEMLKGISEREGLEGWVQSKITKSADMIGSVYHHMDYENSPMGDEDESVVETAYGDARLAAIQKNRTDRLNQIQKNRDDRKAELQKSRDERSIKNRNVTEADEEALTEARDTHCSDKCCGADVKREDCTCPPSCEHCNCNAVNEGYGSMVSPAAKKAIDARVAANTAALKAKGKNADGTPKKKDKKDYKESLQDKLSAKLGK